MATVTIYVSKQADNNDLFLSDTEGHSGNNTITTTAQWGDTIIWKLQKNGGIDQITGISKKNKTGSIDVFSTEPAPVDPSNIQSDWQAIVGQDIKGTESYNISYKIGDSSYIDDPDVEVDEDGQD